MSLIPVCIKRSDCYLLRHETANAEHYRTLHPKNLSLEHRINCLNNLKEIGYQVGTGFMVGSPNQTKWIFGQGFIVYKRILSTDGGNRSVYSSP